MKSLLLAGAVLIAGAGAAAAETVTINSIDANGVGKSVGTIVFSDAGGGLKVDTNLTGLPPGGHGFHVHANPDCGPGNGPDGKPAAGMAAGGHYDPATTGKHLGPSGGGHKGDLPLLTVAADGSAKSSLTAPHLKLADLKGRAVMIHAGGDNYADQPAPLGGGGARIACGVVK